MYRKLDSDLRSSKKRYVELVDQCDELKKGREESVRILIFSICYWDLMIVSWVDCSSLYISDSKLLPG